MKEIRITSYHPSMKDQIVSLTEMQYPFMKNWFIKRFETMHGGSYQATRNELVVAVDENDRVLATISYIYWPLSFKGKTLNSYQMVGLLVHPEARGGGIFGKILRQLDAMMAARNPDAVIGYPVTISKPGFEKQGWMNITDLNWMIRPVSLSGLLRKKPFSGKGFDRWNPHAAVSCDEYIQTAPEPNFQEFRENLSPEWESWSYIGPNGTIIVFRLQERMGRNEAVIGKIYPGNNKSTALQHDLKAWLKQLRKEGSTALASVAVNLECASDSVQAVQKIFFKTNKSIHFIVKSYNQNGDMMNPANWNLMRADMETW